MITLVSVGMSCQAAHQMARFADENPLTARFVKSPFDWLICPPDSAAEWLNQSLCDFNGPEITEFRGRAYWSRFDFWFWHGFFTDTGSREGSDEEIASRRQLDLTGNVQSELSKLAYQREQFSALDPVQTLFCLSNTQNNLTTEVFNSDERDRYFITPKSSEKVQLSLNRFFSQSVNLQIITRLDRASAELHQWENVHLLENDNSEWKGNSVVWNNLLDEMTLRKC